MDQSDASAEEEIEVVAAPPSAKAKSSWAPVIIVIVVMPVLSYAITQFVLIPKMRASLVKAAIEGVALPGNTKATASAPSTSTSTATAGAKKGKEAKPTTFDYAFDNIVVNVSGTKGTRYLKTSFTVFSSNPDLKAIITDRRSELQNLTLNILSSKTLIDLEVPGEKNMLLSELLENFNHTLNSSLIEQVYFSEFVIQ